jgi:uncharacterized membrane protein (UPF0127 family)
MKVFNKTKNTVLASRAVLADTFSSRFIGLLNRSSLPEGEALIITRCRSIHMFFMRFAIDVIFVGRDNRVVGIVERIKPFHLSPVFFKSSYAIELNAGAVGATQTSIGDCLDLRKCLAGIQG